SDGEAWLLFARAQLAVRPDPMMPQDAPQRRARASGAALIATQKLKAKPRQAEAFGVLADSLRVRSMWKPAIDALKVSVSLASDAERKRQLEALRAEHGFRVVDYKVETTGTEPRVCLTLSEKLGMTDVAKFIAVDGRDPQAASGDDQQICIDGFDYGKRYTVTVKADLPAESGDSLVRTAELQIAIRDRSPSVRFSGRAYVLPRRGQTGIPVVSINVEKVAVEVYRVGDRMLAPTLQSGDFLKQLDGEQIEQIRTKSGEKVYSGTLEVKPKTNEEVTTAVPIGEAVPTMKPGIYVMIASRIGDKAESYDLKATQWFVVSDIGLTALTGEDGIHAFVRSLASTNPMSGARVRLVAKNNELLGEGRADANGYVHFAAGLKRGEGGMAPAVLVAESGEGDYAFLDLTSAAFDLSDRGVSGREVPGPVDAFLYAERGVYRPGEEVNLTALVRDRAGRANAVPVTLVITRPDGVEARRTTLLDRGLGARTHIHSLTGSSMTGTWRARIYTDPKAAAIAQLAFLVEDFVPERVELKLDADGVTLVPGGEERDIKVAGRYLYGPPAAGLTIEGDIVVKPASGDLPGFPGFRFGNALEKVAPVRSQLEDLPNTDESGNAVVAIKLPAVPKTVRPLEADVMIRLREAGGRAIERKVTLPVLTGKPRVGIKGLFTGAGVDEGAPASFEAVLIDGENKPVAAKSMKWELFALDQRWQWFSREGSWQFEAITTSRRIGNGIANATAGAERVRIDVPRLDWGRYRLDVSTGEPGGAVSSFVFNAGSYSADGPDNPETLDVALDKPSYKAGETAKVRIASRFAGRAQIAVISNGLLAQKIVDVAAGGSEATLDVAESWLPGAYVAVTLFRPMDETARRMPARAVGIRWLGMDTSSKRLEVSLAAPAKTKPGTRLSVPVKIGGLASGEKAMLTLAAIDAGILGVTRYEPPRPEAHFHGQRRLGVEMRDLYGRLIDGMRAERGRLRSGGDGDTPAKANANPPVEKLLALFSGLVTVGADGNAVVDFDLPEFNGTVRLMAVAWSEGKVGSATSDVVVRDAVALTIAAPRFMMLGDQTRLLLDIHNVEGPAGQYAVTVQRRVATKAPAAAPVMLDLKSGQRATHTVRLEPREIGESVYDVRIA
ncbi:MAG TPA: MG2 domain-containing protein, partial [Hyphomicrobiaceae bacterium]|nr:MG2 domain-containing protein [Hyphomicrobiaceae bacterium]